VKAYYTKRATDAESFRGEGERPRSELARWPKTKTRMHAMVADTDITVTLGPVLNKHDTLIWQASGGDFKTWLCASTPLRRNFLHTVGLPMGCWSGRYPTSLLGEAQPALQEKRTVMIWHCSRCDTFLLCSVASTRSRRIYRQSIDLLNWL